MGSRKRWLLAALIAGITTLAIVRFWAITGVITPAVVAGGSMAESLRGRHLRFTCPDCRIAFRCDADDLPADGELVCPNCGARDIDLNRAEPQHADQVWIDRWPYWWRTPARFEIVAVRQPDRPGEWAVKRVAALPGEQVTIRDGDLLVAPPNLPPRASPHAPSNVPPHLSPHAQPRLVQKSLEQWRQTAVLVHDARYTPSVVHDTTQQHFAPQDPASTSRWVPQSLPSCWTSSNHAWSFAPPSPTSSAAATEPFAHLDWLTFRNIVCHANPRRRRAEELVMDNDGYNQAVPRTLHHVRDLALVAQVRIGHSATFVISIDDGAFIWAAEFSGRENNARLLRGLRQDDRMSPTWRTVQSFALPMPVAGRDVTVEFVRCDGQILIGIDGWSVAQVPCGADSRATHPTSRPLAIAAANGPVTVGPPRVYRDVYYLGPATNESDWSRQLAANEYLLLGDNPPISVDSRVWPPGSITRESIIGKVIPLTRHDPSPTRSNQNIAQHVAP